MKKHPLPWWLGCLLLIAVTLLLNMRYWRPLTEDSCTRYTLTLEAAEPGNHYLYLDFGKAHSFHIVRSSAFNALLEEDALGKEYEILAQYRHQRRSRGYYEVYALSRTDGTEYLTLEQSEAIRQGMLPRRLGLLLALDAALCAVLFFRMKRTRATAQSDEPNKEASP